MVSNPCSEEYATIYAPFFPFVGLRWHKIQCPWFIIESQGNRMEQLSGQNTVKTELQAGIMWPKALVSGKGGSGLPIESHYFLSLTSRFAITGDSFK